MSETEICLPFARKSLSLEMARIEVLRSENPEKCKELFDLGQQLLQYGESGDLSKVRRIFFNTNPDDILIYCKSVVY